MPMLRFVSAGVAAFLVGLGGCSLLRQFALKRALLDVPNERSLHSVPVPRLGGVAVVCGSLLTVAPLLLVGGSVAREMVIWLVGAPVVAVLGLVDDLRPLSALTRLVVQVLVAAIFVASVGVPRDILLVPGLSVSPPTWLAGACAIVWLVATLNIYNFMDGMDGLAATQSVAACLTLGLAALLGGHRDLAAVTLVIGCASTGFLLHNMPPARIFLGDAGSTFLGFSFAASSLIGLKRTPAIPFLVGLLALAPFLLDGTFTLLRRLIRGEAIWRAHRTHLYQRAVATGLDHRDVLLPYVSWMALSIAVGVGGTTSTTAVMAIAVELVALAGIWAWVSQRERRR